MLLVPLFLDLFPPDKSYLVQQLRRFPAHTTLVEFGDSLMQLFDHYRQRESPAPPDYEIIEDLEHRLGFHYHDRSRKLDPPSDILRTIRHMLYGHQDVIEANKDGGKEVFLDHRARLQILLAKRLSIHRVPREKRELALARPLNELEGLLILPIEKLKTEINNPSEPRKPSSKKKRFQEELPEPLRLLEKRARKILRLPLNRRTLGPVLELDALRARHFLDDDSLKLEALERFLELIFELDPKSDEMGKILALVAKAAPARDTRAR